jgi:hypothetical protein
MRKLFSAPARMGGCEELSKSDAVPASLVDGAPADLKASHRPPPHLCRLQTAGLARRRS